MRYRKFQRIFWKPSFSNRRTESLPHFSHKRNRSLWNVEKGNVQKLRPQYIDRFSCQDSCLSPSMGLNLSNLKRHSYAVGHFWSRAWKSVRVGTLENEGS